MSPSRRSRPSFARPWARGTALAGLLLLAASSARALEFFGTRERFEAAQPAGLVEDFEEGSMLPGSATPTPAPLDASHGGSFFAPGDIVPGLVIRDSPGPGSGNGDGLLAVGAGFADIPSRAIGAALPSDGLELVFPDEGASAVAVDVFSMQGSFVTATIFGTNGSELASRSFFATTVLPSFLGVASSQPRLGRILLLSATGQTEILDSVEVVPELRPGAGLGLLAVGAAALAARRSEGGRTA